MAELASKRITGYLNWQRNRRKHLFGGTLDEVLSGVRQAKPDHLALTGDLVNLATVTEIEVARLWLEANFDPMQTTVVPGNHDAYVPGAFHRAMGAWRPYVGSDDAPVRGPLFPSFRRRGPVALIGLSTANATMPFMATGEFSRTQARAAGQLLDRAKSEGLFRIILIHHPPVRGAAQWSKRMRGISRFAAMLKSHGAELVLHGHTHLDTLYHLNGRDGSVPVVGVASASQGLGGRRPPAGFNLFDIEGQSGAWRLTHRRMRLTPGGAGFEEIGEGVIGMNRVS